MISTEHRRTPQSGATTHSYATWDASWARWTWVAGILFVIVVVAAEIIAASIGVTVDDTPAKIARALHSHHQQLWTNDYLSMAYALFFLIYLSGLYNLLRPDAARPGILSSLALIGGVLGLLLHTIPDIALLGSYASKLTGASTLHGGQNVVYALYVLGYGLGSAADVLLSLFAIAAGLLVIGTRALPRWLGWIALVAGVLLILQGFALGGVISSAGVVLDGAGLLFLLIFVLVSSIVMLMRTDVAPAPAEC